MVPGPAAELCGPCSLLLRRPALSQSPLVPRSLPADPLALFSQHLGWLLEKLGLASRLDPELGIHLTSTAALNFLATHLPLSPAQRAMQVRCALAGGSEGLIGGVKMAAF